jgi:DNA polymerase-3 subunit gamma/tau
LKTLEEPPSYAIFILATTEKHKVLPTILSRCQVYDFARITVADIIAHLQYVAQKEGVTVGEDALNVVAQKADGGMRDALSIFDQLVAFCGNTITYEQTIEVLNVLDSDYYFRLVETALKHDVSGALLLLNDVLQRGFDAGNFITGFAQHLRDVLVSKDAATIELLETSDAIRQHYAQQAKQCDAQWLFKALDIVNTCDINYRTARNKRLTVELSLVKLTQLGVQTSQVGQAPQVSQQTPASKPTVAPQPKSQEVAQPKIVEVAPSKPAMQAPPKMATIPSIPSLNTNPSVANQRAQATASNRPSEGVAQSVASSGQEENRPFTLDQFRGAWAGLYTIFKEEPRLLAILKEYTPELIDEQHCVLTLSNPWQKTAFKQFGKSVMDHMRATLHNSKLQLTLQVDETTVVQKAYTAEEKYKVLLGKNEELANLKTALALQLE